MGVCHGYRNVCSCPDCSGRSAARRASMNHSEVRRFVRCYLDPLDYCPRRVTGSGHIEYDHPQYGKVILPSTPSDRRWRRNALAELQRRDPRAKVPKRRNPQRRNRPKVKTDFIAPKCAQIDLEKVTSLTPEEFARMVESGEFPLRVSVP